MVTVRRYWSLEGEVGRRSLSKRSQIGAFGAVRHMGRLDYFGIGPDTDLRRSSRLPAARNDVRHARMVPRRSRRPSRRQRRGIHARSRPRHELVGPSDRRGLPGELGARLRGRTDVRQVSRLCRVRASRARRSGRARRIEPLSRRVSVGVRGGARSRLGRAQFPSVGNGSAAAHSRIPAGPASDAARLSGDDQHRRRCALLHAVHARRQRRAQDISPRHARQRRHARDAARIPQLPVPRSRPRVDAGGISHSRSQVRAHDGVRRRRPGGATHVGAVQRSPREYRIQPQLRAQREDVGRMDVGFGGGEGVHFFWSFGAFQE